MSGFELQYIDMLQYISLIYKIKLKYMFIHTVYTVGILCIQKVQIHSHLLIIVTGFKFQQKLC